jgi:hypothetical protein
MSKRRRKRTGGPGARAATADSPASGGSTRAERDAARARRAKATRQGPARPTAASALSGQGAEGRRSGRGGERPPAPWGSFPLVELCVFLAIVLLIAGFVIGGTRGATMVFAGLALGSLGGLELTVREHFAGFRSHTMLLAGAAAVVVGTAVAVVAGQIFLPVLLGVGVVVFAAGFVVFRRVFKRASGGLSFR